MGDDDDDDDNGINDLDTATCQIKSVSSLPSSSKWNEDVNNESGQGKYKIWEITVGITKTIIFKIIVGSTCTYNRSETW